MDENIKWFAAAVAVVGLTVGGILYLSRSDKEAPAETPPAVVPGGPTARLSRAGARAHRTGGQIPGAEARGRDAAAAPR